MRWGQGQRPGNTAPHGGENGRQCWCSGSCWGTAWSGGKQQDLSSDRRFPGLTCIFSTRETTRQYLNPINQIRSRKNATQGRQQREGRHVVGTINEIHLSNRFLRIDTPFSQRPLNGLVAMVKLSRGSSHGYCSKC